MDVSFLPHSPGVYIMKDSTGKILYIGKANDLSKRVSHYFKNGGDKSWKIPSLVALIRGIDYVPCESERDALVLEQKLIRKHQPFFNQMWKDDKSYPWVKITMKEDFPRILLTRKKVPDGSLYFGPYPKVTPLRSLLRYLWRIKILPLRECRWDFSVKNRLQKRKINACLYYHTGQCPAPCAGKTSKREYRKLAKRAALLFSGQYEKLKNEFALEMEISSRKMNYERAALYRNHLRALEHISERVRISRLNTSDVEKTIGFTRSLTGLKSALALPKPPVHIEAFDTSHIFGKNPVGSMVCFVSGEKNHGHYRRFKIKTPPPEKGGDDFSMINEIVWRRLAALKKDNSPLPDLLLIDGGKGQLSSALEAASALGLKLPIVSLAKENEEIYKPGQEQPVKLDRSDPALQLLQRIRDEAHRFAISYHKYLRNKQLLE